MPPKLTNDPAAPNNAEQPASVLGADLQGKVTAVRAAVEATLTLRAKEALALFDNGKTIDLQRFLELIYDMDMQETRALAPLLNKRIIELWRSGQYTLDCGDVDWHALNDRTKEWETTTYEGMLTEVERGHDGNAEGGITRIKLNMLFGTQEDLTPHEGSQGNHGHKGPRIVTVNEGIGEFVGVDMDGKPIREILTKGKVVIMPAFIQHNFRALPKDLALVEFRKFCVEYAKSEKDKPALIDASRIDEFVAMADTLFSSPEFNFSTTQFDTPEKIDGKIAMMEGVIDVVLATLENAESSKNALREILQKLTHLELNSVHPYYVNVHDPEAMLHPGDSAFWDQKSGVPLEKHTQEEWAKHSAKHGIAA